MATVTVIPYGDRNRNSNVVLHVKCHRDSLLVKETRRGQPPSMDNLDPFESPKALLTWAREDTERFVELERTFLEGEPYERFVEFDPRMQRDAHRLRFTKPVPSSLRKLASHIVNDLRHALDQSFFAAASHFGWQPTNKQKVLYFPFATTRSDLQGRLRKVPTELHEILFEAEPYFAQDDGSGGDDIIRELGKIGGPNKHEAALTSCAAANVSQMKVNWHADWRLPHPNDMWDSSKEELTLGYFPPGTQGDYNAELTLFVTFRCNKILNRHAASTLFSYWGDYATYFSRAFEDRVIKSKG